MNLSEQIAGQLRAVYLGGNWTASNLQDALADVAWQQATEKLHSLNTIAMLVYHVNYYVEALIKVLRGGPLEASDQYSFDLPPVMSADDWRKMLDDVFFRGEELARLVERFSEQRLQEPFADGKYGNVYRNITGIIEHIHYHLGQIVIIKKLLR